MTNIQSATTPCAGAAAMVLCPDRSPQGELKFLAIAGNPELGEVTLDRHLARDGFSVVNAGEILVRFAGSLNGEAELLTPEQTVLSSIRTLFSRAPRSTAVLDLPSSHIPAFITCGGNVIDFTKQSVTPQDSLTTSGVVRIQNAGPRANLQALHSILYQLADR